MNQFNAAEIKEMIDVAAFYEFEGNRITSSGKGSWKMAGLCPFHSDRKAGSFFVHPESGAFKCFSCGEKGGDFITFLMKKYEMPYKMAIETLRNGGYHA
jgi:putative DNA primase/helicase